MQTANPASPDDRYRLLFDYSPNGVFLTRTDGTIEDANAAACRMLGMTVDEIRRAGRAGLVQIDEVVERALAERAATGMATAEISWVRKDGSIFLGETTSVVIDPAAAVPRAFVILRDITERKRAEEAVRERNEYIDTILENAPIGFAVNTIDDGVARFVSQRFEAIYGVPQGSLKSVDDYFRLVFRDPVFREQVRERMVADMASRDATRMRWDTLPLEAAGGEPRYVTAINIPLFDRNLMVSTVQDVTERVRARKRQKEAEEALREGERRFTRLIETASEAIFVQANQCFAYLNHAAVHLFGARTAEELLGRPVLDRFHPSCHETIRERIRMVNDEGRPVPLVEEIVIRLDGALVMVEVSGSPTVFEGRRGAVVFARDITERKRLEAQLEQSQRMESIGRLAGGVAHDFNNMLGIIMGYTELRLSTLAVEDPARADLEEILGAARKSADLTRQLLAFARRQTIRPEVVDLNEAVQATLKMLARLIGEDIALHWLPADGLWAVKIDPSQVDQILANLAVNSRDAMPAGGRLTIETRNEVFDDEYCARHRGFAPGEYVCLAVSDNGEGMDAETARKVFEPFFTTKPEGQGTGLGLATVYGIVKQHGGFIDVYSEPGLGTTFRIWFARHLDEARPPGAEVGTTVPRGTETVLLVEDSVGLLKLGRRMLTMLGYTVLAAAHPLEAIEVAAAHAQPIDLLVTDVVMPDMNGRELATRLAATRPNMKCLFMSGYTANVIAQHGVLDESMHFVQKPFTLMSLAAGVRRALERQGA